MRAGLRQIISGADDSTVVEEVADGHAVADAVERNRYDAVILDVSLPGKNGLEVLKDLRRKYPRLPVLILSMHPEEQYAVRAFRSGAAGYVIKDAAPEELLRALEKVLSGGKYVSSGMAERLALSVEAGAEGPRHETLSDRELEVLCLLSSGNTVGEIGRALGLSPKTVSTYRTRISNKMGMETNAELIRYAIEHKLI